MKKGIYNNKKALGLIEVVIAVVIVIGAGIPILKMVSSSRSETSSSANYLRAMELADEVLEWASVAKFKDLENALNSENGTIIVEGGSGLTPEEIHTAPAENENWKNSGFFIEKQKYSDQYNKAFYFRTIEVEDVKSPVIQSDMLKKVTVTVKWIEGRRPSNLNVDNGERNRQVKLSILVINDDNLLY